MNRQYVIIQRRLPGYEEFEDVDSRNFDGRNSMEKSIALRDELMDQSMVGTEWKIIIRSVTETCVSSGTKH